MYENSLASEDCDRIPAGCPWLVDGAAIAYMLKLPLSGAIDTGNSRGERQADCLVAREKGEPLPNVVAL